MVNEWQLLYETALKEGHEWFRGTNISVPSCYTPMFYTLLDRWETLFEDRCRNCTFEFIIEFYFTANYKFEFNKENVARVLRFKDEFVPPCSCREKLV